MTNKDPGFRARLWTVLLMVGGLLTLVVVLRSHVGKDPKRQPGKETAAAPGTAGASGSATAPAPTVPTRPTGQAVLAVAAGPAPVPISLTGSDGSGLELVSLHANAVVEDPLAFTELRLVFRNPEPRVREGRFRITLPSGATISRFAMRIGEQFQEGEVVEQQAARVVYEDFLHRRQDPALLESEAGNEFSARVFPIPAHGTKELIVSYSQELTRTDEPYLLPLRGLPRLGKLSIRALVGKTQVAAASASSLGGQRAQHEVVEVDKADFMPDRDFTIEHSGSAARLGLRHDNLVAARIVPLAEGGAADPVSSLLVLLDTSASRALGLSAQLSALGSLLAALPQAGELELEVAAFDQEVTPIYRGKLAALGDAVTRAVLKRRALGASNLDHALGWLEKSLPKQRASRVLLVSDGVVTAGETASDKLRARIKALAALGVERLDVLAVGGIRDDAMLARLVTSGLPRDGMVLDAERPASVLASKLTRATRSGVRLEIDGAGWIWPNVLHGVQPGDELVVYADLPESQALRIKVDGTPLKLAGALSTVERPLLERAWVQARMQRLLEQRDSIRGSDRDLAEALKKQVIELSTRHRVLSPFTSLLVLESERDYARFGIARRALADILTVDAHGIALLQRKDHAPPVVNQVAATAAAKGAAVRAAPATSGKSASADVAARAAEPLREQALAGSSPSDGVGGGAVSGETAAVLPTPQAAVAEEEASSGEGRRHSSAGAPMEDALARPAPASAPPPPAPVAAAGAPRMDRGETHAEPARRAAAPEHKAKKTAPLEGELKLVLDALRHGKTAEALARALAWRDRDAGDVLALVALGEVWEASGDQTDAARAYGSIIDLFPGRADMRRFAGERLERVKSGAALALAVDTYRAAVEQRPDHPASHRLLGFALLKQGRAREAFEALVQGARRSYPEGRFRGVERILQEDLGLAAAAWIKAEPGRAGDVRERLRAAGGQEESGPSLRFVLNWETDENDVDFHIFDGVGGHAFYSAPHLVSGGELYADVTTGYGPECFTIRQPKSARAFPYKLQAHYYRRGPMGYGMGKLQVIDHDGQGGLSFQEHPFVVMQDGAYVELGTVRGASSLAMAK